MGHGARASRQRTSSRFVLSALALLTAAGLAFADGVIKRLRRFGP